MRKKIENRGKRHLTQQTHDVVTTLLQRHDPTLLQRHDPTLFQR